jgi:hypothetical protein
MFFSKNFLKTEVVLVAIALASFALPGCSSKQQPVQVSASDALSSPTGAAALRQATEVAKGVDPTVVPVALNGNATSAGAPLAWSFRFVGQSSYVDVEVDTASPVVLGSGPTTPNMLTATAAPLETSAVKLSYDAAVSSASGALDPGHVVHAHLSRRAPGYPHMWHLRDALDDKVVVDAVDGTTTDLSPTADAKKKGCPTDEFSCSAYGYKSGQCYEGYDCDDSCIKFVGKCKDGSKGKAKKEPPVPPPPAPPTDSCGDESCGDDSCGGDGCGGGCGGGCG